MSTRKSIATDIQKKIENMVHESGRVLNTTILNHNYYFLPYEHQRSNSLKYVVSIEWECGPNMYNVVNVVKHLLNPGIVDICLTCWEGKYGFSHELHYESKGIPRRGRICHSN